MSFAPILQALALPPETLVEQRVPKKLLLENGAPTAGDKRQISEGIEECLWHAALKPATVGVPAFRDATREYLEIAVVTVQLRPAAKPGRLVELIHRAIPYPVLLITRLGLYLGVSVAHKRWSELETGKVVLEELRATASFQPEAPTQSEAGFLARLRLTGLPRGDLFGLYQGWLEAVLALEAAQITGSFAPPASADQALVMREALASHAASLRELARLRAQAERETQINRRVDLNLAIKKLEDRIRHNEAALTF